MYHNRPWGASSASESTPANNPFLETSASNRFPALDTSPQSLGSSSPYPSQTYPSLSPSPYPQSSYNTQQIQPQYTSWNGQPQPQSPTFNQGSFQGYAASQQQYQATGYAPYGQQYGQQAYVGQLQPQPQPQPQLQAQYTGYMQNPQHSGSPQQYQQSVISQFDPYNVSGGSGGNTNGWSGQNQSHTGRTTSPTQTMRPGPSGQPHPRQFIQSHKVELESWNAGTWKQAINLFNELKRTWEKRRIELQKHLVGGQYLTAEDIESINTMIKNSESNIDTVTASWIQMQEVHSGYKHSLDGSGKQRVREALNAGLQGLPDWP